MGPEPVSWESYMPDNKGELPFRYLKKGEFASLTHDQQIEYLRVAIEALKKAEATRNPLDWAAKIPPRL